MNFVTKIIIVLISILTLNSGFGQNDLYFIAKRHFEEGSFQEAIEVYTQSLEKEVDYRTYMGRAQAFIRVKEYEQAIQDYTEAISLNPEDSRIYYNRGNCFLEMKEEQAAFADFNKAIEIDPANYHAYNSRGFIYYQKDSLDKAEEDYLRTISLNLNYRIAYINLADLYQRRGEVDIAIELMTEYLQYNKNDLVVLNYLGDIYTTQGNYDVASRFYFTTLNQDKNQPETIEKLSVIMVEKLGHYEQAITFIETVELDYSSLLLTYLKGKSQLALSKYKEATVLFHQVRNQRKKAEFEKVDLLLVTCLFEEKKYPECLVILDSLEAQKLFLAEVYVQKSMVFLEMEELKKSLKYLELAIGENPKTQLYLQKAYLLNQLGKSKKALALYDQLDTASHFLTEIYSSKAFVFDRMNMKDSACNCKYQSVVYGQYDLAGKYVLDCRPHLNSEQKKVLEILNLMQVFKKKGMVYKELSDFDFLVKSEPNVFDFYLWRGIYLKSKASYSESIEDFSKCIELEPNRFEGYFFSSNAMLEKGDSSAFITTVTLGIHKTQAIELLYSRALFYKNIGDTEYAFNDLKEILSISPSYSNAYYQLGLLFFNENQKEKACKYFKQAILLGNSKAKLEFQISCQ